MQGTLKYFKSNNKNSNNNEKNKKKRFGGRTDKHWSPEHVAITVRIASKNWMVIKIMQILRIN